MSKKTGPNDSPGPYDCVWVSTATYNQLESDLAESRQKLAEAELQLTVIGELAVADWDDKAVGAVDAVVKEPLKYKDRLRNIFIELPKRHAETEKKLAEAQAECAAKADALRQTFQYHLSEDYSDCGDERIAGEFTYGDLKKAQAALASNAGDALVKELEELKNERALLREHERHVNARAACINADFEQATRELERLRAENARWQQVHESTMAGHRLAREHNENWQQRAETAETERDALRAQRDQAVLLARELGEKASALVQKMKLVHDSPLYQSVWFCAANHGVLYKDGPTYAEELKALALALNPPPSDDTLKV